jgi:uncharacterized protein (TIGR03086 family)
MEREIGTMAEDVLDLHRRALAEFGRRVHAVRADQWGCPTPCADWEVRNLVNHLVAEQLWVPPLLAGKRVADLGAGFAAGDVLGDDPVAAWDAASSTAAAAFAEPGALERVVHLSYADRPGEEYAREMIFDLVVHSWDLARGISADESLDPALVEAVYSSIEPDTDLAATGLFDQPVPVPADADEQTRLIAFTGRQP